MKYLALLVSVIVLNGCVTNVYYRGLDYKTKASNEGVNGCGSALVGLNLEGVVHKRTRNLVIENLSSHPVDIDLRKVTTALNRNVGFPLTESVDPNVISSNSNEGRTSYGVASVTNNVNGQTSTSYNETGSFSARQSSEYHPREQVTLMPKERLSLPIDNVPNVIYLAELSRLKDEYRGLDLSLEYVRIATESGAAKAREWMTNRRRTLIQSAEQLPASLEKATWSLIVPVKQSAAAGQWERSCLSYSLTDMREISLVGADPRSTKYKSQDRAVLDDWAQLPEFAMLRPGTGAGSRAVRR